VSTTASRNSRLWPYRASEGMMGRVVPEAVLTASLTSVLCRAIMDSVYIDEDELSWRRCRTEREAAVNGGSICAERYSATANDLPEIPIRSPKGEK
jgi:hypothetical protein